MLIILKKVYYIDYQENTNMSNLEASYKLILKELSKISGKDDFYFKPIKPKLSDIELIRLVVLAEFNRLTLSISFSERLKVLKLNLKLRELSIIEETEIVSFYGRN